uniref:FAD-binding domain-containing protein n=1 Tax=Gibberella zeae TaxID=5518 RepID=A0A4E9E3Q1_GIBZA
MDKSKHTVIIAGGGIAGLTLANMLEKADIDYVLLESYEKIAPQVGASIGLQSNGLRIIDQLGCADTLLALVDNPLHNSWIRNSDGSIIKHYHDCHNLLESRHGYPTVFIDRQSLLEILYDNLKSKDSVHPGQAVKTVMELDNGVQVTTDKGKVFKGDILVGADGIYSTVRKEMWRIGNEASPGYFPDNEWSKVPCYYKCIFGISKPIEELIKGTHYVYNDKFSYLVMVGPGGKWYWFLFARLPAPLYGDDIPRYTKEDEAKLAQEHASDQITPEITFGDLYEARTNSTLTPLHEWVFQKWHYNRIITIGDAAHKLEPLTGHGGNSAIETAASVMNHILSGCPNWSDSEIKSAFSAVQNERFDRVQWLVDDAHKTQEMNALASPFLAFIAPKLAGLLNTDTAMRLNGRKFLDGTHVHSLPIPEKPHSVPFTDQLPARPFSSTALLGLGVLSQGALFRLANQILLPLQTPTTFMGEALVTNYTGVATLDQILAALGAAFGVFIQPENRSARLQWIAFTPLLFSTALDWTLESYRAGSRGLPTSFPSVFGAMYQLKGIGRIAPLYHLLSVCEQTVIDSISMVTGRAIDVEVVKASIPGLALGVVVPTALMIWPWENKVTWQQMVALWQPFPVYVGLITAGVSTVLRKVKSSSATHSSSNATKESGNLTKKKDPVRSLLRYIYAGGAATATAIHLWSLYKIWSDPELSVSGVFGTIAYLVSGKSSSDPNIRITEFLQRDLFLNGASVLVHSLYRTLCLRRVGYITNRETVVASLAVLIAQPIVGPAAAHIGFLGWREDMLYRVNKSIKA